MPTWLQGVAWVAGYSVIPVGILIHGVLFGVGGKFAGEAPDYYPYSDDFHYN